GARRQPYAGDRAHGRGGRGEGRERDPRDAVRHVRDGRELDRDLRVRDGGERAEALARAARDRAESGLGLCTHGPAYGYTWAARWRAPAALRVGGAAPRMPPAPPRRRPPRRRAATAPRPTRPRREPRPRVRPAPRTRPGRSSRRPRRAPDG